MQLSGGELALGSSPAQEKKKRKREDLGKITLK